MYKNPLNNGDVSHYNSLKKQRNYGAIIKKYENEKLKTKPNELQKYYQYLTYQQPILDELNYVAERMRNEDIKTKNDDFNFIEDLKIKREGLMKKESESEKDIARDSLFDKSSEIKNDDKTAVIKTDVELEYGMEKPITIAQAKEDLGFNEVLNDNNKKEEKFKLSREEEQKEVEKAEKAAKKAAEKEVEKAEKAAKKAEKKAAEKEVEKVEKAAKKAAEKAEKEAERALNKAFKKEVLKIPKGKKRKIGK